MGGQVNLVLIGFMGTGKSAIGRALARRLNGRHIDTDREIERQFGMPIPRIFQERGEAEFRAAETEILRLLTVPETVANAAVPLVVSTGGGTPMRPENAELLSRIGVILWLSASTETILTRVGRRPEQRPLLAGYADNPRERIETLLKDRIGTYAALAQHNVDTSSFPSPDDAALSISSLLKLNEDL